MSTANRRRLHRHLTCVPAGVQVLEEKGVVLIRDCNATGALLFSRSKLNLDQQVRISIMRDEDRKTAVEVQGRVVRVERLEGAFWPFGIGVAFEPPREDLSALFQEMAERQERLFGSKL